MFHELLEWAQCKEFDTYAERPTSLRSFGELGPVPRTPRKPGAPETWHCQIPKHVHPYHTVTKGGSLVSVELRVDGAARNRFEELFFGTERQLCFGME
jgi:hypothetical protein